MEMTTEVVYCFKKGVFIPRVYNGVKVTKKLIADAIEKTLGNANIPVEVENVENGWIISWKEWRDWYDLEEPFNIREN
mgnify:CR=1 FL=1